MPALPLNVDLHIYLLGRFVRVLVLIASQVIPCLVKAPLKGTFSSKSKPLLTCNAVYPSRRFCVSCHVLEKTALEMSVLSPM